MHFASWCWLWADKPFTFQITDKGALVVKSQYEKLYLRRAEQRYRGGRTVTIDVPLERVPRFVRE